MSNPARAFGPRIAVLLLAVTLTACIGKGGTSTRYYLVDSVPGPAATMRSDLAVEIMDLEIPQYLEKFQIATRSGPNGVVYSEYNQWGEALRKNLLRVLARNLSLLLGTDDVGTPLNRSLSEPGFRVQVHIDRFEQDVDGYVHLEAHWQVLDTRSQPATAPITRSAELVSDEAPGPGDYVHMVAAMSHLFGALSAGIAADVSPAPGRQEH